MKKILTTLTLSLLVMITALFNTGCNSSPTNTNETSIDTNRYTDVVIVNKSELDSVQVFVTLQGTESIIGKFGMDSSNIVTYCIDSTPCVGSFWAKKGVEYHLNDTTPLTGVIVTWGVQNQACPSAQSIVDKKGIQLYPYGINNFEFTVNTWYQNGNVTGNGESFDITCVDGLHSLLEQKVTSFGKRDESKLSPNFRAFWDYGYKDSTGNLSVFTSSANGWTLSQCVNIPGVYPYGCDWGYKPYSPPTPCNNPPYVTKCSTKWGQINTSQTNRQGQGGQIICTFFGFTRDLQPATL